MKEPGEVPHVPKMTRFARAKGSKASNERLPEQATSWKEMKKQLHENRFDDKKRAHAEENRLKNYNTFLNEEEDRKAKDVKWAQFPGVTKKRSEQLKKNKKFATAVKRTAIDKSKETDSEDKDQDMGSNDEDQDIGTYDDDDELDSQFSVWKTQVDEALSKVGIPGEEITNKPSEMKRETNAVVVSNDNEVETGSDDEDDDDSAPEEVSAKVEPPKPAIVKPKRKKTALKVPAQESVSEKPRVDDDELMRIKKEKQLERRKRQKERRFKALHEFQTKTSEEKAAMSPEVVKKLEAIQNKKKAKSKQRKLEKLAKKKALTQAEKTKTNTAEAKVFKKKVEMTPDELEKAEKKRLQQKERRKRKLEQSEAELTPEEREKIERKKQKLARQKEKRNQTTTKQPQTENTPPDNDKPRKPKPQNLPNENRPKKPDKMIINGESVELGYVDGFPVIKDDADRLTQLHQDLTAKGIPKSEVQTAMKLERRKAEKRLARQKKNVCLNCREFGHYLSQCPKLNKDGGQETLGAGICFKCGSTEHTHFECRVVRGLEYKFAQCFICKEQGHISRQCPDNPKGVYPKGGACKVCGDVTHLKKDCPENQVVQEEKAVNLQTIDNGNIEDLDVVKEKKNVIKHKINVVVTF